MIRTGPEPGHPPGLFCLMAQDNPFKGVKTYRNYKSLWALTAAVILLQAAVSVAMATVEILYGVEFIPLEGIIPSLLVMGAVSFFVLHRMGVPWRGALAGWGKKFPGDLLSALKYFGGYILNSGGAFRGADAPVVAARRAGG